MEEKKVVIVTGGAMGIGRAIAERFAADGAAVVIADVQGADEAAAMLAATGAAVLGVVCDISDPESCKHMAARAVQAFGRIDTLVNNAGLYSTLHLTEFSEITAEEWQRVLNVNVMGQAFATAAVVPVMRAQGGGSIVNMSSGTPFKGVPYLLHYVASKGAVNAMTKALAKELGGSGIRVNAVAPGFTLSDGVKANPHQLEKLRDISQKARVIARDQLPEDVVGAVAFLASQDAAFMTGQTLVVDGGAYFH
ncbi:glucose 1-dehydrogenase [Roseibacterium sp. SDUM158016]|uniref:SDR family NAD(P)-dependent oxidoreductase n=1 Tax=Roseicyclus sediminis TaxID=2980997 RepID=UPI0021D1F022|nr:glucose 1-dehydrogenase [Roseibacterium sp. SDUM158016]MCU4652662.1 glucose 1-dehydrogenase [Roseibacterium sp. SDUM158016]